MNQYIPQEIEHNILNRKSIFSFSSKHVEEDKLALIFEAASLAPSSFNAQPWRFIFATKEDVVYKDMLDLLADSNKTWATTAPILILTIAEVFDTKKNRSNHFAMHDVGLSTANLMLQASALGLYTHPMGGYDSKKAKELFGLPEGFEPVTMIALGYQGDSSQLSDELLKRQNAARSRKKTEEFVFKGRWKAE